MIKGCLIIILFYKRIYIWWLIDVCNIFMKDNYDDHQEQKGQSSSDETYRNTLSPFFHCEQLLLPLESLLNDYYFVF